jgi:hypothetical protein
MTWGIEKRLSRLGPSSNGEVLASRRPQFQPKYQAQGLLAESKSEITGQILRGIANTWTHLLLRPLSPILIVQALYHSLYSLYGERSQSPRQS